MCWTFYFAEKVGSNEKKFNGKNQVKISSMNHSPSLPSLPSIEPLWDQAALPEGRQGLNKGMKWGHTCRAWSFSTLPSYLSIRSSFSFSRCSLLFRMLIHCAGSKVGRNGAKAAGWWQTAPFWSWETNRPGRFEPDHRYLETPGQRSVRIGSQGLVWLSLMF